MTHLKQLIVVVLFSSIASTAACGVDQPGSAESDPCAEVGPDDEPLGISETLTADFDGSGEPANAPETGEARDADAAPVKQCLARCNPNDVGCGIRLGKLVGTKLVR